MSPHQETRIHLLSGWSSVPAHEAWIASEENQELLRLLTPYLTIDEFVHLDIEFEAFARCLDNGSQSIRYNKVEGTIQRDDSAGEGRAEIERSQAENGKGWLMVGRDVEGKTDDVFRFEGVPIQEDRGRSGDACELNRVYV